MPNLALDLRYLKYAIVVAEQGSFRRAADILNLPQSTVSRRIQILERTLGLPLFERSRIGARPTLAGERFIREAAVSAEQLRQAVNEMALIKRGDAGELKIGLMASLASGFLSELLEAYHRRFPHVDVKLEEATAQVNAASVLNGRLDAAFIPGDPRLPGCQTRYLWSERIFVALPDHHLLAASPDVTLQDVRGEIFLVTADAAGPEIEDYLVRQLSGPGFRPKILIQRVGRENLMHMVAKGFGITLTTCSTLGAVYPGVSFLPIGDAAEVVCSSVIWSMTNQNPALKGMVDLAASLANRGKEASGPP
ncbi:LysR substrate-binding domain-containing protein [Rhizobium mongolense]|uniref:LysR substrate-binding domain-containing protein n=1 Tax=Rhizobium mongolense TaxID=57676 RepID=UPI003558DCF6